MRVKTTDLCDEFPDDIQVAEPLFSHFGKRRTFHGPTATIKVHEDNVLVKKALGEPGEGRVLVVDGGGSLRRALMGDILAGMASENGWAGVVINGCIRDSVDIAEIDIGVLALNVIPLKSGKRGDGYTEVSVSFAGLTIRPGDYLYADQDGLLLAHRELTPGA
jgi:regulator of ribonuclease activity A